ncbi:MAG TPA: deoxyribonuclease IV [Pirellulales bacterium]|nr:deoxyribonuclease IV [Pirellulales bacterium]
MPILGSHTSIAGGYYKAIEIAHRCGCDCLQVFTKNSNQWRAKPILEDEAVKFRSTLSALTIGHPIAHNSYLINLASPDEVLWRRSIEAFVVEIQRAELLGLAYVVTHPGACVDSGEKQGLRRVVSALNKIHRQTRGVQVRILLETTAGQGSCLGHRFEQLAAVLDGVKQPERLGVCVDTCHIFAAGYPLHTLRQYRATMKQLAALVGLERVKAFHLNDSKRELGSRVDRHEHIGRGKLGLEPFRHLLNDERFQQVPMYLETPKGIVDGEELDVLNLRTLRGLVE